VFGSTILDVAAGVIFGFLAISLFTSAGVEAINSFLKLRATNLKSGIIDLVNDPNFVGLAKQLYEHASISPLGPGLGATTANPYDNVKNLPSYIEKAQFARAFLDVTGLSGASAAALVGPAAIAALNAQVATIADPQIRQFVQGAVNRTQGDIKLLEKEVADWFDFSMDRLSGAFKRWTQLLTFVIALIFAFVVNLDSLRVGSTIWQHPAIAEALKAPTLNLSDATDELKADFPIGWPPGHAFSVAKDAEGKVWVWFWQAPGLGLVSSIVGWLITAVAALFGAPFWFDTLQSIIRLKGSGPSPAEKAEGQAAST